MWLDEVDRENKVGADVEKVGKGQVMQGLVGCGKVFRFFFPLQAVKRHLSVLSSRVY